MKDDDLVTATHNIPRRLKRALAVRAAKEGRSQSAILSDALAVALAPKPRTPRVET